MTFWDAVRNVWGGYGRVSGRAGREELGWWLVAALSVLVAAALLDGLVSAPLLGFPIFAAEAGRPLTVIAALVLLLPTLAVAARRLHDFGISSWWLPAMLALPLVGWGALAWILSRPTGRTENRYGSDVVGLPMT